MDPHSLFFAKVTGIVMGHINAYELPAQRYGGVVVQLRGCGNVGERARVEENK